MMRKNIYAEIYNIKHGQHRHTHTHTFEEPELWQHT